MSAEPAGATTFVPKTAVVPKESSSPSPQARSPAGRRGRRGYPKGRGVAPAERQAVEACLAAAAPGRPLPWPPDLLLEALHALHDQEGSLSTATLAALAAVLRLPAAEVYATASFYAHFDVRAEGEAPPPPVTVRICSGPACALAGAAAVQAGFAALQDPAQVRVMAAPCLGRCAEAPAALVRRSGGVAQGQAVSTATVSALSAAVAPAPASGPGSVRMTACAQGAASAQVAAADWAMLQAVTCGALGPERVLEHLTVAGLRGLGGAGFPVARKWQTVRAQPGPRVLVINADEGEPGTFKDRFCLETAPLQVLEGALIAARCVEADAIYLYLRDEYPHLHASLAPLLAAVMASGRAGGLRLHLRRGAGAYVCGEETALLESLEGRRGQPRQKPPFPAIAGLFGRPTLVQNVETLFWVPRILREGGAAFAAHGRNGFSGLRLYSVSGRVRRPGVVMAGQGSTLEDLLDAVGGMAPGFRLGSFLPGGASGGILPAADAGRPLAFGSLDPVGASAGSGAVVVLGDTDDPWAIIRILAGFFAHESCGQCTPCRLGTAQTARLLTEAAADPALPALLTQLHQAMRESSLCGLGQVALTPVLAGLRHFPRAFGGRGEGVQALAPVVESR